MMCRLLEVKRSTYYAWRRRQESRPAKEDRRLVMEIELSHKASDRTYGSPRVHQDLRQQGIRCGRKRAARLMRENGSCRVCPYCRAALCVVVSLGYTISRLLSMI